MSYLTDRKRATGMGSAKEGAHHHWNMTISSAALLILVPLFVFTVGGMIGEPHGDVAAYFSRPFPALIAVLTIVVGFMHFKNGVQVVIEDYVHGFARKLWIVIMTCVSYGMAATGVFAIAKLAL